VGRSGVGAHYLFGKEGKGDSQFILSSRGQEGIPKKCGSILGSAKTGSYGGPKLRPVPREKKGDDWSQEFSDLPEKRDQQQQRERSLYVPFGKRKEAKERDCKNWRRKKGPSTRRRESRERPAAIPKEMHYFPAKDSRRQVRRG